jgi:DNA polymerase-4
MLIRLLGVRFSHLVHGTQQLNMFEDTHEMVSLYRSMDAIRQRYGSRAIGRAAGYKRISR